MIWHKSGKGEGGGEEAMGIAHRRAQSWKMPGMSEEGRGSQPGGAEGGKV